VSRPVRGGTDLGWLSLLVLQAANVSRAANGSFGGRTSLSRGEGAKV